MKKFFILQAFVFLSILLAACSAPAASRQDYDTLAKEYDSLKNTMSSLESEVQALTNGSKDEPGGAESEEPSGEPEEEPSPTPATNFGARKNPVPLGQTLTGEMTIDDDPLCNFEMKIISVLRGSKAWGEIKKANANNDKPPAGKEYVLFKVSVKNTRDLSGEDSKLDIDYLDFKYAMSDDSIVDDYKSVVLPDPVLDFKLYEGSQREGCVAFLADKADKNIKAVFSEDFWFLLQ
jgi:outer membrane murein-binding lipoprotein Lpp